MDDMSYIETLTDMICELEAIVTQYRTRSIGIVGKANLVNIALEQNIILTEALKRHARVLRFHLGEPVAPVAHSAEAVLIGTMGMGE